MVDLYGTWCVVELVMETVWKKDSQGKSYSSMKVKQTPVDMKKGDAITLSDAKTKQLLGAPKGRLALLIERGVDVWRGVDKNNKSKPLQSKCKHTKAAEHSKDCCTFGMLMSCDDFDVKESKMFEIVRDAGHIFMLLPKFHCELAAIERVWCRAKWWCRRKCGYSIVQLRKNVLRSLSAVGTTLTRKYWNTTFRLAGLYYRGLNLTEVEANTKEHAKEQKAIQRLLERGQKQYTRHRDVSAALDAEINLLYDDE
jgi:hypothetical protein